MINKEEGAINYIEGVNSYLNFLINDYNNITQSIPSKETLTSAKLAIISNMFLSIKENLVENVGNLCFSSKLLNNYLEENVSMIAKKTNQGYLADKYLFPSAGNLVAIIRNKLAHGKYLINYEDNYIEIQYFDGETEKISIDTSEATVGGHGGSDYFMMNSLNQVLNGKIAEGITFIDVSVESHLMSFAAEESRLNGGNPVNIKK